MSDRMAKTLSAKLPSDAELDRATDPEYAAISTMAIIALIVGGAGVFALIFQAGPLVIIPVVALVLGVAALLKIRRSDGVLTGAKLAIIAIVLGGGLAIVSGGRLAVTWWTERQINADLKQRAMEIVDAMIAGEYGKVWNETPAGYRSQFGPGIKGLQDRFAPQFQGAGNMVSRELKSLTWRQSNEGAYIVRSEVYVEFERRYLDVEVWFRLMPDGKWHFDGVGASVTLESQVRFPDVAAPPPVVGPWEIRYEDEHHHHG
jgi:hypothetical protein